MPLRIARGIYLGPTEEPGQQAKARQVFDDPYHLTRQDREVDGKPRWQTIGMVREVHVLLVAHAADEDEEVIHIISARKATRRERREYAQSD